LAEADQRDARVCRPESRERRRDRGAAHIEGLGDDGGDSRDGARDEMLECRDGVDMLQNRSSAHRILQSCALETPEDERSDTRMQTCALGFRSGGLAIASMREKIASSHRAQG
jgi:hypothetical protein